DVLLDEAAVPGVVVVDAPDLDSIEHANRELSDHLVEASDLAVFVTTATRYADRVPWSVLARLRERELSTVVVVNRMPPEPESRATVLTALGRLLAEAGLRGSIERAEGGVLVIDVREGAIESSTDALDTAAGRPLLDLVHRLH